MTDELLDDTWNPRDFPVLREAARLLEVAEIGVGVRLDEIAAATGLDRDQTYRSVRALENAGLLELHGVMPAARSRVIRISADARRLVGLWPSPETALDRMLATLQEIEQNTDDADTRSRARKVLDSLTGAGRQLGIEVAAAVVTRQVSG